MFKGMKHRLGFSKSIGLAVVIAGWFVSAPTSSADQPSSEPRSDGVVAISSRQPLDQLLGNKLGGIEATGAVSQFGGGNLAQLTGPNVPVFQSYAVDQAASRDYGRLRAEIFETKDKYAAFGLFTFHLGVDNVTTSREDIGDGAARLDDQLVFWKGRFFARVTGATAKPGRVTNSHLLLARALADSISAGSGATKSPSLMESLPVQGRNAGTERYFLGPDALAAYVSSGREMFPFPGDAEAAFAEYEQGAPQPLKLLIVEYHTPQFATDAMTQASAVLAALPQEQQNRIILKRVGNYVVEASNVSDQEHAQALVDAVEYPYTVKWLRNPLWPTNDPFRAQKAAQMLLSTFGVLGLILLTVAVGGAAFGTTVFIKRRKQQRQAFSDAGGMLRLDIDPFESVILGLPPKRDEG